MFVSPSDFVSWFYEELQSFIRFFMSDIIARTCCSRACVIFRTKWALGDGQDEPEDGKVSGSSGEGVLGKSSRASRMLRDERGVDVVTIEAAGWTLFSEVVVSVGDEPRDDGSSSGDEP